MKSDRSMSDDTARNYAFYNFSLKVGHKHSA